MKYLQGVLFDWAGTTIDYGCMAPVGSFIEMFAERGISVTVEETRRPMGMAKIDHIRAMLDMPNIRTQIDEEITEELVCEMNRRFECLLFRNLKQYTTPIPGVVDVVNELRGWGLKIGTTTGYTREMMKIVREGAAEHGFSPEIVMTSDDVGSGRPFPWMAYAAAKKMGVYPMSRVVKVGDTVTDMEEGKNAGAWTVGVVYGSSEFGLDYEETKQLSEADRIDRANRVRERLIAAGADHVIDYISDLPTYLLALDQVLATEGVSV